MASRLLLNTLVRQTGPTGCPVLCHCGWLWISVLKMLQTYPHQVAGRANRGQRGAALWPIISWIDAKEQQKEWARRPGQEKMQTITEDCGHNSPRAAQQPANWIRREQASGSGLWRRTCQPRIGSRSSAFFFFFFCPLILSSLTIEPNLLDLLNSYLLQLYCKR